MKKRLIFLGLLIASLAANAQIAATNTGILYISTNSDIFYSGSDFTNSSTLLTNNGRLYVKGNLTNNQTPATIGTGTLYLVGSSTQTISGSAAYKTYNLSTNTAGITLNNNLSVSGTHTFVAGNISTSATPNYLIYEAGAAHTGSSDAAHVTGWVKKIGTTGFTFPVGNTTYLRNIATSNLSASMELDAVYNGATTNPTNIQSPLSSIDPSEYWTLDNVTGGATTAQVTLNWDNSKIAFPNYVLTDIRSANYTSSNWTSTGGSATGSTSTTGIVTSTPLNVMGAMSIGSITFLVPLNFLSVTAEREKGYTLIEWKTANEANVKYHEVQRSFSIGGFTTIATVAARNTINTQTYYYNDADNLDGIIYYRIKSVDLDGQIKYSKVIAVSYGDANESMTIKNNPVKAVINISLTSAKTSIYHYQLFAANGSMMQQGNMSYRGTKNLAIPLLPSITNGTYILHVTDGRTSLRQKIIVE